MGEVPLCHGDGALQLGRTQDKLNQCKLRFRGGLVFKAHRLLYHSTLGVRVTKKKKKKKIKMNVRGGGGVRSRGFFLFFTRVTGPRRSLNLKLRDSRVNEPQTSVVVVSDREAARPVHLIITIIKWIRTSMLSIKNSISVRSRGEKRGWRCSPGALFTSGGHARPIYSV